MDLLGGSVGMNVEPDFTMPSSLLRMRDSGEQVKCFSVSAVQRRAIQIIFQVTSNMPYQFAMAWANFSSVHTCREDLKKNSGRS